MLHDGDLDDDFDDASSEDSNGKHSGIRAARSAPICLTMLVAEEYYKNDYPDASDDEEDDDVSGMLVTISVCKRKQSVG